MSDRDTLTGATGWFEFVSATAATTHIAYVYEDASVYLPEGRDVVDQDDFTFATARGKVHRLVRAAEFEGWRPPAQVIETIEALAALRTGTVIRSRHGDVASIDHGPDGQWTGPDTRLHYIGVYMAYAEPVAMVEPGAAPWTVLHMPTETGDSE